MELLTAFLICAMASFLGAFFGVRTLKEAEPLKIPVYSQIKEAVEKKREDDNTKDNKRIMNAYLYGGEEENENL